MFRGVWFLLAALAIAHAVAAGRSPVATVSMSCAKIAEPEPSLVEDGLGCTDSLFTAVGMFPLTLLAVLLAAPPVVAGVVLTKRVSWLATGVLAALAVVGLLNWTGFWGLLLVGALPGAIVAAIISAWQPRFRRTGGHEADREVFTA